MGRKTKEYKKYEEEVLKLIEQFELALLDPLPKTAFRRKKVAEAKEALATAKLIIKIGKAAPAFILGMEYQQLRDEAYSAEALEAHKNLGGRKTNLEEQRVQWFIKAFELREKNPAISAAKMAQIIDPQKERSVRRFISECEKEGTLARKLAK